MTILSVTKIETVLENKTYSFGATGTSSEISKTTYVHFSNGNRKTFAELFSAACNAQLVDFKTYHQIIKTVSLAKKQAFIESRLPELTNLLQLN